MEWIMLAAGFAAGAVTTAFVFARIMQNRMVVAHPAEGTFDEVCDRLEKEVKGPDGGGWGIPFPAWDLYASQLKKDFKLDNLKACRIYPVCKPAYANEIVREQPHWTGIMPCSWAVYQTADGRVYISKMNMGMMSLILTGLIGRVMKKVAGEESRLLRKVLG